MRELSSHEKEVLKNILEDMKECGLFIGRYDAKNGSAEFMHGIASTMECLAYRVGEDYGTEFEEEFLKNMIESEKKVLTN